MVKGILIVTTFLAIFALSLSLPALAQTHAFAQTVETPVNITRIKTDGGTMSIPRWKAFMHPQNGNLIWVAFGNWGYEDDFLMYTTDGGDTWNSTGIYLASNYNTDYHLSLAGDASGDLYTVAPTGGDIEFTKVNYPGRTASDAEPYKVIHSTGDNPRANVMVQPGNNRVWVFTRQSGVPSENVLYQYSDNGGDSWTSGRADYTGYESIRIGSMPYVNGNPALVVAYLGSPLGYKYYLWNGSAFEEKQDAQIFAGNIGNDRAFTHNVIQGNYFHLVFGLGNDLHHCWKAYNNGTGAWNHEIIDNSAYTSGIDWETTSCVRGNELFVFYRKQISSDPASSEILMKKWSQTDQTWSTPVTVSIHPENTTNMWPNTVMNVPTGVDFIPVFYYSDLGLNDKQVYYTRITLEPTGINDFEVAGQLPKSHFLKQNHPNPFNPATVIEFVVPARNNVSLEIYDILGRKVNTLVDGIKPAGRYSVKWEGTDNSGRPVSSGIYLYRLKTGDHTEFKKMILAK